MKFGYRTPSISKRISSKVSPVKHLRNKYKAPNGMGTITNPEKSITNKVYHKATADIIKDEQSNNDTSSGGCGCLIFVIALIITIVVFIVAYRFISDIFK